MQYPTSKTILVIGITCLLLGASTVLASNTKPQPTPTALTTDWSDNFDSYPTGSYLGGQGDWAPWDLAPAANGHVTDAQAQSTPNAYESKYNGTTAQDMVHTYSDMTSGEWIYTAWLYVPSTEAGQQYFILMNNYQPQGTHNNQDWSLQLIFDAQAGYFSDVNGPTCNVTLITDQWVKLVVDINLDTDTQTIYYNDVLFETCPWTTHVQPTPPGILNIGCVDLYAGNYASTACYWDDLSLVQYQPLTAEANGPYTGIVNTPIQFSGSAIGGTAPYTYAWTFGDGATSTEQNPTHAYTTPGDFTVTLTVTDNLGSTASDTATVTVAGPTIEIEKIAGGMGITVTVKNSGSMDATNIDYNISCSGGLILKGKSYTGTIDTLAAGADTTVTSKVLGFGKTTITAAVGGQTKTASGFVLLFFVLGVK
jgi:hypothetical protein